MKISVIGTGFVGLVTGACLASNINKVICVDKDKKKIKKLNNKFIPFYEPGLSEIVKKKINKSLFFSSNYESLRDSKIIFITIGTPEYKKEIYLKDLENAIIELTKKIDNNKKIIIIKSTVPVGTTRNLYNKYFKNKFNNITLLHNPEFLREGTAVSDFEKPDRIVIGSTSNSDFFFLNKIYKKYKVKMFNLSLEESEISKYYSNAFFSMLISFSNQFAILSDHFKDVDFEKIKNTLIHDRRIKTSNKFPSMINYLVPGIGYGGSCFPKDNIGIKNTFDQKKIYNSVVDGVIKINDLSLNHCLNIIKKNIINKTEKICILGAAFKENTDDTRHSKTLPLNLKLKKIGFKTLIVDPKVKKIGHFYCEDFNKVLLKKYKNFIILTRWKVFKEIENFNFKNNVKIFDFRNFIDVKKIKSKKVKIISFGKSALKK